MMVGGGGFAGDCVLAVWQASCCGDLLCLCTQPARRPHCKAGDCELSLRPADRLRAATTPTLPAALPSGALPQHYTVHAAALWSSARAAAGEDHAVLMCEGWGGCVAFKG